MVRPATIDDLREVSSWISTQSDAELWAGWRAGFPIDPDSLPAQIEFSGGNAFCLLSEGRLVGFGQLVEKPARRGHLARIIVNPVARRQGHGQALIAALLEVARQRSYDRVSLNVDRSNVPAEGLYFKLGFADAPRPADEPVSAGTRYLARRV